ATTAGNRLVVEVGVWGSGAPTASAVTDDAGDTFVKLLSFTASDHTEMSVWTAPVATGGTRPTITARPSAAADLGVVVLEYAGLSTAADATVLDQQAHATGSTGAAATVSSGATGPADRNRCQCRRRYGRGELDRAEQRRCHDHLVHGDAVRREYRPGVEHRHRYPAGHHGDRHRADRRHRVHVHGHRHQRGRYRS